jgi:galactose mutarotase-like enzyme
MRTMRWKTETMRGAACAVLVIPAPVPAPLAAEAPPAPAPQAPAPTHSVASADFGTAYDRPVSLYTLKNKHGLSAKVMTYGATLTELDVPDRAGHFDDVVLGFDSVDEYVKSSPYFRATIGRVANRIKRARFELGGKTYTLAANNAPNHLHGGKPPGEPVPDGSIKPVKGTPFDFSVSKLIGKDLKAAGGKPVGFDLNYVANGAPNELRLIAKLKDPKSGRVLTLSADQPGLQFYSGNFLDGTVKGKGGVSYAQYSGLCLESQKFPNSINVPAWKDAVVLKPGQTYQHTMVHAFSVE